MNYTVLPFDLSACGSCTQCEVCYVAVMIHDRQSYTFNLFEQVFEHALHAASQRCNLSEKFTVRATLPRFTNVYSENVITIQASQLNAFSTIYPLADTQEWRDCLCNAYVLYKFIGEETDHGCLGPCTSLMEDSTWCWETLSKVRSGLEQVEKSVHIALGENVSVHDTATE